MISIKRCDVTESHMGERLKSSLPNFEKSLMKHYAKLEWVGRKCPASSQAPPNKDFRIHEGSYIQFFYWWKGRRLALLSTLNTQSLIHGLSHQLSLFCSVFFYDFTKIVFRIREVIENTMFKDFFQGLFRVESLNWQAMVTLLLYQASQLVKALGLTSSPLTHTLARSTWIHFEHSPVRSWSLPSPLPKCELTGAPAPVEAAQVCLRVPHFAPHSVPHTRLEICQKNYTTGFLGQKIYTLKETA